jgi:hypothetical protein
MHAIVVRMHVLLHHAVGLQVHVCTPLPPPLPLPRALLPCCFHKEAPPLRPPAFAAWCFQTEFELRGQQQDITRQLQQAQADLAAAQARAEAAEAAVGDSNAAREQLNQVCGATCTAQHDDSTLAVQLFLRIYLR